MTVAPAPGTDASRVRTELHADMICDAVSNGQTLAQVCRDLDIARHQIYAWIEVDEVFRGKMEVARAAGYDAIADEAFRIADDGTNDYMERQLQDGRTVMALDRENVQRSKLRVETRLKLLAKWHPKRYGEKLEIESTNRSANVTISDDPNEAARQYADLIGGKG